MIKEKDLVALRKGIITSDDLLEAYPVKALVSDLCEIIKEGKQPSAQIVVTSEEFDLITSLFRIKGFTSDNGLERRGRPKKESSKS